MTQVTKNTYNDWIDTNYDSNGNQEITGLKGRKAYQDLKDSVVWYNERMKVKAFPYIVEHIVFTEPTHVPNLYYIQKFNSATPSGDFANVEYNDIVQWDDSASLWKKAVDFTRDEDWIIYTKGAGNNPELGQNWLYSNRDVNIYTTETGEWIDIKENKTIPHNYSLYKQGGNGTNEFYHLSLTQYNSLINIGNSLITFSDIVVVEAFHIGSGPHVTPIEGNYYLIEDDPSEYILKRYISSNYTPVTITDNIYVICLFDKKTYLFNKTLASGVGRFVDSGIFIHSFHNLQQVLQGGNGVDQFYHLTAAQYNALSTGESYFFLDVNVIDVVDTMEEANLLIPASTNGDYVIINSISGAGVGEKLYKLDAGSWVLQTAIDKKYLVQSLDDSHTWFYNSVTDKFEDIGIFKLADHNLQENLQGGGGINEFYHVQASFFNNINVIELTVNIYIDVINGNDSNGGTSLTDCVKTANKVSELLDYRHIVNIVLRQKETSETITTFLFSTDLEKTLEKNKYLQTLALVGVVSGIAENKTYTVDLGNILKADSTFSNDYYMFENNIIEADSGIYDEVTASNLLVSPPAKITGGTYDAFCVLGRYTFNNNFSDDKSYKIFLLDTVLNTDLAKIENIELTNSILNVSSALEINYFKGEHYLLRGSGSLSIKDTNSNYGTIASDFTVTNKFINNTGGLVLNSNSFTLNDNASFVAHMTDNGPITHFNNPLINLSNSVKFHLTHTSSTPFTITKPSTFSIINILGDNSDILIKDGGSLYKNALCNISSGINDSNFYEVDSSKIKMLVDELIYKEYKSIYYLPATSLTTTPIELVKVIDKTKTFGFNARIYVKDQSGAIADTIYEYNILWDGSAIQSDGNGISGTFVTTAANLFTISGDYITMQGALASGTMTADITIEITRYFNE